MRSPDQHFDSETVALMGRVCLAAWQSVYQNAQFISMGAEEAARSRMVDAVMSAVTAGERDETRLIDVAVAGIEGCEGSRPLVMARQ
jgi:hypothetical protein